MDGGTIRQAFLVLLSLTYIGLGIFIFVKKVIGSPGSELLAVLFVAYGGWRLYRALTKK